MRPFPPALALLALVGCTASGTIDSATTLPHTGTTATGDAPVTGTTESTTGTGDPTSDGTSSITGTITRSAQVQEDGAGTVYVAVFDGNPINLLNPPSVIGQALVADQDLNAPGATVAYVVEGVPAWDQPYHVMAFFDDNGNVDAQAPKPDQGDLVSMEGMGAPTVVVSAEGPATLDLVLNAVMPF